MAVVVPVWDPFVSLLTSSLTCLVTLSFLRVALKRRLL